MRFTFLFLLLISQNARSNDQVLDSEVFELAPVSTSDYPVDEVVNETELKTFGRGFKERSNENAARALVLACYHQDCNTLRFVMMTKKSAHYTGRFYRFQEKTPDENARVTVAKLLESIDRRNPDVPAFIVFYSAFLAIPSILIWPKYSGPLLGLVGVDAIIMSVLVIRDRQSEDLTKIDFVGGAANRFLRYSSNTKALLKQDGWNWGISPKRVSKSYFNRIVEAL